MVKYLLIGIVAILIFILGFVVASKIGQIENKQLKAQIEEIQKQKISIDLEKEQLKASIDAKKNEAALEEAKVANLTSTIEANRKILANERSRNQKALENYEKELANISIPISNVDRCSRLCNARAELGFPCIQDYCSQYK